MTKSSGWRAVVSAGLLQKILADERMLSLSCQPIVDLRRGVIVGYEALARFALKLPVPPNIVFASAQRLGLGEELELVALRRALELSRHTPPNCFLTINVDPQHLLSPRIIELITAHGSLAGVVFELTEHSHLEDVEQVAQRLKELRRQGAFIAVDDAGAGYSGLQRILALRPQFLKVDHSLVSSVDNDAAKRATIQMLGELAERLDAWIIAEGVETSAELHALTQLGVPLAQGFALSHPLPPWSVLSSEVVMTLDALPRDALTTGLVDGLVEPALICGPNAAWPKDRGVCVRLESSGRPLSLRIVDHHGEHVREAHELLRVKRESPIAAVALRCTLRPEHQRWDPVVCIDELGHFEGLIHVHTLVWALASGRPQPANVDVQRTQLAPPQAVGSRK